MKAFYLIHAAMILEIILTIFVVLKLHEVVLKIKVLKRIIKSKTALNVQKIQSWHEKIQKFNKKCEEKLNYSYNFDLITNFIKKITIQGLLKKFVFPKKSFFAKILDYKATIFWFLLSFLFFKNKKA